MSEALHIIDRTTARSLLDQLALLAGGGDRIVSLGPAPTGWRGEKPLRQVHAPLNWPGLCGRRIGKLASPETIIHAWSHRAALAGEIAACQHRCALVWSLACMPDRQAARDIRRLARCPRLRMTVPTRACRDALVKTVAPEASVSVLPPAARPIDRQAGRRQRTRGLLGLGNRQRLIVAPGEVMRDGAHKMAVWVFAILRELRDDLRLLLPETGPALPNVRSFAEATGHESETYMAEGRAELADCLAAADVAVLFPRQGADAYALTAAMAAGLPIAASGTADVSEIAPHGEAALLAPPGDPRSASAAVLKLLEDADLSARLSMEARRIAGQFHPRQVRGQLEGIYAALRATAGA